MSALIGALRVSLSADTAQFEQGMARARSTSAKTAGYIRTSFGGIGVSLKESAAALVAGLSVGFFARLIKQSLEYAGSLAEAAQQIGVTAQDLQTLRFAAGQVGVSQDELETGLSKLTITLGKVAAGAKEPAKALAAIGISVDEIKHKDTGEAFRLIADGLQKVTDRSQRAAVEVALFGKTGSKLDNLLAGGSAALNQLTDAAQKLGIVLSDEQIARADETADRLEALKTVLSANIAGVVADNADSILTLANALASLVQNAAEAIKGWKILVAEFSEPIQWNLGVLGSMELGARRQRLKDFYAQGHNLPLGVDSLARRALPSGADIPQFLAPGGRKHSAKADHSAEDRLRSDFQFAQQLNRAQQDVLNAQQELAKDYVERTTIGIEILNKEKEAFEAEQAYNVALYALTKGKQGISEAQAAQLRAQYNIKDSLERQKLLQDEQEQRQRDVQELTQHDFDRRRSILESQDAIATTAAERRKVELQLLELAYQQKKQALESIIATSKDEREIEDARRDLINLNQTHEADRQAVLQHTRGPLEEWAASVPQTADQINEALQSIEAQGLDRLSDAITDVITGTRSLKDAFGDMAKSILADLIRMSIRMLIFRALSSAIPGLFGGSTGGSSDPWPEFGGIYAGVPGFATGGSMRLSGMSGVDTNVLSANGVPIARYTAGERINIANDNVNNGGGIVVNQTFAPNFAGNAATHEDLAKMALITKTATIDAINQRARRR